MSNLAEDILRQLKNKANTLPLLPGVYIMKDKTGTVIYVGKARKLKNRVTQYFGAGNNHTEKVRKMVNNVNSFDYIICDSEFEALTLENSLIKQYMPKYNILLKDDKGYHYIQITDEKWKRIKAATNNNGKGSFIGPYNSGGAVKQTVQSAVKIFKLPICNRSFDKPSKPCLNYHIGLCMAPCRSKTDIKDYNESVDAAVRFIKSGGIASNEVKLLEEKMEKAAEELNFEYAAKLRDRIIAIKKIGEKQKVISGTEYRHDVIASALAGEIACVQIFVFKNGHLSDEQHFFFDGISDKQSLYSDFLPQYYDNRNDMPKEIFIDAYSEEYDLISLWLTEKNKYKTVITVPQKSDKKKLVDMCASNAAEHLAHKIERNIHETAALNDLANLLGMDNPPRIIESYDISNMAGSNNVAGMVVFKDGRPFKPFYRKFNIKSFSGQDDYRSLSEVLDRRFNEYEKGSDEAFKNLPDLMLIDGGEGQLNAVKEVMLKHGIDIAVFGMVKDSKHRTSAIAYNGGKIVIKANKGAYKLVTEIQDEVHRFAISFHKSKRSKAMLDSTLKKINGIGPAKEKALLKHFKTLKNIKSATREELLAVSVISENNAEEIIKYFSES